MNGRLNVYESIVTNIKRDISLGILAEGDKLPSCRETALQLGVNPNTVQRAYSELEAEGIIFTIPKKGVYVAGRKNNENDDVERVIETLKVAGVKKERLMAVIEKLYRENEDD